MAGREPNRRSVAALHRLREIIPVRSKPTFDFLPPALRRVCAFAYGDSVHMQAGGRLDNAVLPPPFLPL